MWWRAHWAPGNQWEMSVWRRRAWEGKKMQNLVSQPSTDPISVQSTRNTPSIVWILLPKYPLKCDHKTKAWDKDLPQKKMTLLLLNCHKTQWKFSSSSFGQIDSPWRKWRKKALRNEGKFTMLPIKSIRESLTFTNLHREALSLCRNVSSPSQFPHKRNKSHTREANLIVKHTENPHS